MFEESYFSKLVKEILPHPPLPIISICKGQDYYLNITDQICHSLGHHYCSWRS